MHLRLVCYMSWVKQGSEAMDFPPTFFQKKLSTKKGVAKKFCANFYLCSIRKKYSTKSEFLQILCKHKIFLTGVYMIFKYGKRFRFASSFNYREKGQYT